MSPGALFSNQTIIEKKPLINIQIRATQVRVVDEEGRQLGVFSLQEAVKLAQEKGLDLVQVTDKADPPVCRITDFGKYLYNLEKKERHHRQKKGDELKQIRITFGISDHDLGTRALQTIKFLEKGDKIKVEMRLRGRENAMRQTAEQKISRFLELVKNQIPIKIEREIKKEARSLTMIIAKS